MRILLRLIVIALFLVVLLPILYMFGAAFAGMDTAFLSEVFTSARYLSLLYNTLLIAALTTLFSMAIGVPLGFIIARFRIPFRRTAEYLLLLPLLIPSYFITIAWVYFLGINGSLTNYLKDTFHLAQLPFTIYGMPGAIFVLTLCHFPLVALLTITGLKNIDTNLEKAAWLTATPLRAFIRVSLPLLMPYIIGSGLLVFVLVINNFDVPAILLVDVYPLEIFYQFSVFFRTDRAMLLTLPPAIFTGVIFIICYYLFRNRPLFTIGTRWQEPATIRTGWFIRVVLFIPVFLVLGLAVLLPMISIIISAGSPVNVYNTLLLVYEQFQNSLSAALLGTAGALVMGILLAVIIERTKMRFKELVLVLAILTLVIPGSTIGIGLIKLYNQPGLLFIYRSIIVVVLGLVARFMVIPMLILGSAFKSLDPSLENAAKVSGSSWARTWLGIVLPLSRRPLIISALLCFIMAVNELGMTILVAPPGFTTISVRIYSLFHFNKNVEVASICLLLAGIIISLYLILSLVIYRRRYGN